MSDVLPFPTRVTVEVEKLAEWLASVHDLGFSEGMMEADAPDIQRMEAMARRAKLYPTLVRLYMAMIRASK